MKANEFPVVKKRVLAKMLSLRTAHGYSQEEVAAALSINQNTYSKLETGITYITLYRLCQLSSLYNISIGNLLDVENTALIGCPENISGPPMPPSKISPIDQVNQNSGLGSRGITTREYYEHHEHHNFSIPFAHLPLERINLDMQLACPGDMSKLLCDASHIIDILLCTGATRTGWSLLTNLMHLNLLMPRINQVAIAFLEQRIEKDVQNSTLTQRMHESENRLSNSG